MEFDIQTGLITAVTALTGALGILWRTVESSRKECVEQNIKCEEELRKLWQTILTNESK